MVGLITLWLKLVIAVLVLVGSGYFFLRLVVYLVNHIFDG